MTWAGRDGWVGVFGPEDGVRNGVLRFFFWAVFFSLALGRFFFSFCLLASGWRERVREAGLVLIDGWTLTASWIPYLYPNGACVYTYHWIV